MSTVLTKINEESGHPCRLPLLILKICEILPFLCTILKNADIIIKLPLFKTEHL